MTVIASFTDCLTIIAWTGMVNLVAISPIWYRRLFHLWQYHPRLPEYHQYYREQTKIKPRGALLESEPHPAKRPPNNTA